MTALGVARTFQNIRLFSSLTVLDNVRIGRHCRTKANFFGAVLRTPSQRAEERHIIEDAMAGFVESELAALREKVGDDQVVCALSGGVDSTVVAVMLHKAIGKKLHCIFVDNGLLRLGEGEEVAAYLREHFDLNLNYVQASKLFLDRLAGVTDPEQKRKIIGTTFIEVFEAEAAKLPKVKYLAQGTLYPDVIESVSFKGPSAVIKSHHNVGGLPDIMCHLKFSTKNKQRVGNHHF